MAVGALALLVLTPANARAATALPATISSNTTLTAAAGPYTGNHVTVSSGVTLTIEPGAVLKVKSLTVNGFLLADGTATDPIIFTSPKDDSAGGDTNGDGSATLPAAGDWNTIDISTSGRATIDQARMCR